MFIKGISKDADAVFVRIIIIRVQMFGYKNVEGGATKASVSAISSPDSGKSSTKACDAKSQSEIVVGSCNPI